MMSQQAVITFVNGSAVASVTLEELKQQLLHYKEQTALTGKQLSWEYEEAAFPYTIESKPGQEEIGYILKGTNSKYRHLLMGVGKTTRDGVEHHTVELVLPDTSSHGDKNKGNEFMKYLAKTWKAELTLFNGRRMYYNPRK